jgi:hypothetical protein
MPIPKNIKKEHVLKAIIKIQHDGLPIRSKPRKFAVKYERLELPCKLLISWANIFANGEELDLNPNNFQTDMAKEYLAMLGFEIVKINK